MKNFKHFLSSKGVKAFVSFLFVFTIFSLSAFAKGGGGFLDDAADEVESWVSTFKRIMLALSIIGALVGGVMVAFKMKNAEGGEGKKYLFAYGGGILFLIIVWVVIEGMSKMG